MLKNNVENKRIQAICLWSENPNRKKYFESLLSTLKETKSLVKREVFTKELVLILMPPQV